MKNIFFRMIRYFRVVFFNDYVGVIILLLVSQYLRLKSLIMLWGWFLLFWIHSLIENICFFMVIIYFRSWFDSNFIGCLLVVLIYGFRWSWFILDIFLIKYIWIVMLVLSSWSLSLKWLILYCIKFLILNNESISVFSLFVIVHFSLFY